jgi:hypothetical protein
VTVKVASPESLPQRLFNLLRALLHLVTSPFRWLFRTLRHSPFLAWLFRPITTLLRRLGTRFWYIHPPVVIAVRATRTACMQTLTAAARPSQERLHLRNLFQHGQRYAIYPNADGFQLTTQSRIPWARSRRSPIAAVLIANLTQASDELTFVRLRARMSIPYLMTMLIVPAWISVIMLAYPWWLSNLRLGRLMVAIAITALFGLAWLERRFNAMLQASDMVYFVQKALEDLPAAAVPLLAERGPDLVQSATRRDFRAEWEKFYQEHK